MTNPQGQGQGAKPNPFGDLFQAFPPLQVFDKFPDLSIDAGGLMNSVMAPPAASAPTASPAPTAAPSGAGAAAPPAPASPHTSAPAQSAPTAAAQPPAANQSSLGVKALNTARGEIGVKEVPKGSNRGPRVDQYQNAQGQYWCCHFVSWCVEQNGTSPFGHKGWVEGLRRWAKSKGKYIPASGSQPMAGDIFTMARYDKKGKLAGGHTGFVETVSDDGRSVKTIEGNTSDKVARRTRAISSLDGFVRI